MSNRKKARMRKILPYLMLCAAMCLCLSADASYPIVRQFSRSLHKGGPQTWAIAEDSLGRLLFGNRDGLLIFDSETWDLRGVDYGSTVRSLLPSDSFGPRLYAGAYDELGFFSHEGAGGALKYHTLKRLLPPNVSQIKEVWNIFQVEGTPSIWFQTEHYLLEYNGKGMRGIKSPSKITASASIGGKIYVALQHGGVCLLKSGRFTPADHSAIPAGSRVVALLPYLDAVMAVTEYEGVYIINNDRAEPLDLPFDRFLRDNQVFCAASQGNNFAFGTVGGGVVVWNASTRQTSYSNTDTGLQNNTVLSAYFARDGRLWLGLDNGIDMVQVDAPYYSLLGNSARYGAGYMSLKSGDRLYLGTNQGLYVMDYSIESRPTLPALRQLAKGQVWDIRAVDDQIFVSTDGGLLTGSGESFRRIDGIPGCWAAMQLRQFPDYAIASTYDNFYLLRRIGGVWNNLGHVDGYSDIGGRFHQDARGNLWIAHWLKGVYRLQIDPRNRCFTACDFFDSRQGLPSEHNVSANILDGLPIITSDGGISCLDKSRSRIIPHKHLTDLFGLSRAPLICKSPTGDIWCVTGDDITVASRDVSGRNVLDSVTFSPMTGNLIPGFVNLNFLDERHLIISAQEGFYDVNLTAGSRRSEGHRLFISKISASGDSTLIFASGTSPLTDITLPYSNNNLEVHAIMPEYRAHKAVTYSYMLDGYDSEWSPYSATSSRQYTQLPEGNYTLRVKAINSFTRQTSQASVGIRIFPPWYRSLWARIVYLLLALGAGYVIYRYSKLAMSRTSQKLAREKERELKETRLQAQQESLRKDYQIAELKSQQLEADIRHKSEELSNITMNVVRKNEILQEISARLDKIATMATASELARPIARIQSLIKENITRDDDWRVFIRTFDAAYGDFTKRLQEDFPSLTPTELRICCYLVMGLSSKEIAQLSNISYRSVEMTRYRLRKKLELSRDTSLVNFLHTYHTQDPARPEKEAPE